MYESQKEALLAPAAFARRLSVHLLTALALLVASMGLGMLGYVGLEQLSPVAAFLNTAMLLGGMGPVNMPVSTAGKLFAGFYALYAGLVFIASAALIFTPIVHRVMHKLHWSERL